MTAISSTLFRSANIEHLNGDLLYARCYDSSLLRCFDLEKKEVIWELRLRSPILETIVADNQMLARLHDGLAYINLMSGKAVHYLRIPDIVRLHQFNNHIILHKKNNQSEIIHG